MYILLLILVSFTVPNLLGRIASWSLGVCPNFTAGISSGLEIQKAGYSLYCIHVYEGLQEPVMAKSVTCGEESK